MTKNDQIAKDSVKRRAQLLKDVKRFEEIVFEDRDWEKAEEVIRRRPEIAKRAPEAVLAYAFEMADIKLFEELERWGVLQLAPNPRWGRGDALQQAAGDLNLKILEWIWARNDQLGYGPKDLTRALVKAAEGVGPEKDDAIHVAAWLLDRGAMVNGDSELPVPIPPLEKARYHPGLLEFLISRGATVNWPPGAPRDPVLAAARCGAASLQVLAAHGARFDQRWLLRNSLDDSTGGAARFVLAKGCNREDMDADLAFAARLRSTQACRALVEAGGDPTRRAGRDGVPMEEAVIGGNWDTVLMFVTESDSVRQNKELLSWAALKLATHRSASRGPMVPAFKALLDAGAELPDYHEGRTLAQVMRNSSDEIKRVARSVRTARGIEDAMGGGAEEEGPTPSRTSAGMSPL